jgi:putative spermidine/putrescine transport system ATP-binding protein
VFQNYALFPHRSVAQNIGFGLRMRRLPKEQIDTRVAAALAQVQLQDFGDRYPAQLSGGQQQRVALARATVIRPRVLLCDEPLGALDRKLRIAMQFELKELQRALGVTLIYVTHDQEEALTMSDRIAVMNNGRIEQVAPPAEIYDRPATRFVSGFIGEATLFSGKVRRREDGGLDLAGDNGLRLGLPPWIHRAQGTPLTVAIRPERLSFAADRVGRTGAVAEANFLGTATLFKVLLDVGVTALVRVPSGEGARPMPCAGDRVTVNVPESGLVPVADS